MPSWALDMIGVFLGAVLGAIFAYAVTWLYDRHQSDAKRKALYVALVDQLETITVDTPAFSPEKWLSWPPVHVSAANQLLAGDTLQGTKEADLIRALVTWQSYEDLYNEQVEVVNRVMLPDTVSDSLREAWHLTMVQLVTRLRICRKEILRCLPAEYRTPRPYLGDSALLSKISQPVRWPADDN